MARRIGFLVNPIAGVGGRVGLKGSDGVVALALARGATPRASERAIEMLTALRARREARRASGPSGSRGRDEGATDPVWVSCAGAMGEEALRAAGFERIEVVHRPGPTPRGEDTRRAVQAFLAAGVELVVFCGGDGTARDVCSVTGRDTPVLGVPAGVKMVSGVFGVSPARTAGILDDHLEGRLDLVDADVLDVDEEAFREGRLEVKLHAVARTPGAPRFLQASKRSVDGTDEETAKARIAEHLAETFAASPDTLFLLGPGGTLASIAQGNGLPKTLLGIDAVRGGVVVGRDLAEQALLELLEAHDDVRLVLSPIGAQGFVLGRGNQPLSPEVVRRIGRAGLIVVATPAKLALTPMLRFDTGDASLDAELAGDGFLPVVTGYHTRRLVDVCV